MTLYTALIVVFLFSCGFALSVAWLLADPPLKPIADIATPAESKVAKINDMLAIRSYHHEHMEGHLQDLLDLRDEWIELHGEDPLSNMGCELTHFWLNRTETYADTLDRVNRLRTARNHA